VEDSEILGYYEKIWS